MIPIFYSFITKSVSSNASRTIRSYSRSLSIGLYNSRFSLPSKSNRGRNSSNRRVIRTLGKMTRSLRRYSIAYTVSQKCLGIIASFYFIPFKNRFLTLLIFCNGLICYTPALEHQSFFQYLRIIPKMNLRFSKFKIFFNRIGYIKKLSSVSLLELSPLRGVQYCRGTGSRGRLFAMDRTQNTAIIELPSKLKKIFPLFSICALGRLMGEENRFFSNTKSGY